MPYRRTLAPTQNRAWIDAILNRATGSDTTTMELVPTLHLIGATPVSLTPDTPLATLTAAEAVFSGYGDSTPTLTAPANSSPNTQALLGGGLYLGSSTGTFTSDVVTGYWLQDGADWVQAELFPAEDQVPISANGDYLALDLIVPLSLRPLLT